MNAEPSLMRGEPQGEARPSLSVAPPTMLAGRTFQFMLLTLSGAGAALARYAISPLQETMRGALALSDNQMALLQGPALALPVMLAAVPLGLAIDRYSRVRLILIFTFLDVVGSLLTAFAPSFAVLFASRCLVGLAVTVISTTAVSLLADLYQPEQRGRAKAVLLIGQYAGASVTFAFGGALLANFDSPEAWRYAMLWLTGPLLLLIVPAWAMREPPRSGVVLREPSSGQSFVELWRYRAVAVPVMGGIVMAETALFAILTWASPTLARTFSMPPDQVGATMAIAMIISGTVGPILGGTLGDFCQRTGGPRRTAFALAGVALLSISGGLFALAPQFTWASVLLVTFFAVVSATVSMGITLLTIVIPNELRGLCLALLVAANSLFGMALAPLIVSSVSSLMGGPALIGQALALVCITSSIAAATLFAWGRRQLGAAGTPQTRISA